MSSDHETIEHHMYHRASELSQQLQVSRRMIYTLISQGKISIVRINNLIRIPHQEYLRVLSSGIHKPELQDTAGH